jgi:hypothetical protein
MKIIIAWFWFLVMTGCCAITWVLFCVENDIIYAIAATILTWLTLHTFLEDPDDTLERLFGKGKNNGP